MYHRRIQIKNGTVYDPRNGINGEKLDIFIADGKIVEETKPKPEVVIDARGKTVMPGGIDLHSHIATYGLNLARFTFRFPTLAQIGETYAMMGYTHVNEPLMTLNTASYVHHELSGIPLIDTSASLVLPVYEMEKGIREGHVEGVNRLIIALLGITRAINARIYDLGIRYAKKGFFYRDVSPRRCLDFFHRLVILQESEGVPRMQLRTYPELLDEDMSILTPFWMAHLASGIDNDERYEAALKLLKSDGCADLGISIPPPSPSHSPSPSPDGGGSVRIGYEAPSGGSSFISMDIGLEQPLIFSNSMIEQSEMDKRAYYSLSLALDALKYYRNLAFSTDSSSGCLFYMYPRIFAALLSDTDTTRGVLVRDELPRNEYSLYQLVSITRDNPARQLGMGDRKGHLGTGADADIAIYDIDDEKTEAKDLEKRFRYCSYLLKGGEIAIKEGRLINRYVAKRTIGRVLQEHEWVEDEMIKEVCTRRSLRIEHLVVDDCFTLSTHY